MRLTKTDKKETSVSSESNKRIYDFLKKNQVGVLATVDLNGNPHAATIYFSVDNEFNTTFITKNRTKKHDNLKHNNHAMIVVYEPVTQTTIQIIGVAETIDNKVEAGIVFIDTLKTSRATSNGGIPPISKLHAGEYVAYKLKPVQIRMAMFIRPDAGGYEMYETIDFDS